MYMGPVPDRLSLTGNEICAKFLLELRHTLCIEEGKRNKKNPLAIYVQENMCRSCRNHSCLCLKAVAAVSKNISASLLLS